MLDPSWIKKLDRAEKVEKEICDWYQFHVDPKAYRVKGYCPKWDIVCPYVGNIEVKEDRMAHQTNNYAIEIRGYNGEPSGLEATKAKQFVLVDWEYVCFMLTKTLKSIVRSYKEKRLVNMGWIDDGNRQSQGWLIPRELILNHKDTIVTGRWFPIYD